MKFTWEISRLRVEEEIGILAAAKNEEKMSIVHIEFIHRIPLTVSMNQGSSLVYS